MDLESEKITGGTGEGARVDNFDERKEGAEKRDEIGILTNLDECGREGGYSVKAEKSSL